MKSANQFSAVLGSVSKEPLRRDPRESAGGPAAEDPTGRSYNEEMFRYFLTLERKRFERSGRPFLLLLVELRKRPDANASFEPKVAAKIFGALWQTLRDTDFVGWYREGHVAGAVLTQAADAVETNMSETIRDRVWDALCDTLVPQLAGRLQVRVYQLPGGLKEQSQPWH